MLREGNRVTCKKNYKYGMIKVGDEGVIEVVTKNYIFVNFTEGVLFLKMTLQEVNEHLKVN